MDTDPATDDWKTISDPCPTDPFDCYGDFQPAFSPNGTRIAFVSSRVGADGTGAGGYELYVMDALGEVGPLDDTTRLTTDVADPDTNKSVTDSQVTWSSDGSRIAFLSTGRGGREDACDVWAMDSRDLDGDGFGDNLQRLTFDDSFNCDAFEDMTPQWSPNSDLIVFTSTQDLVQFDIWLVNADDPTDVRNVTQTPNRNEDQPGWSPDGTQIMFPSDKDGAYEMYSLPVPPPTPPAVSSAASSTKAQPAATRLTFDGQTKQQADWGAEEGSLPGTVTLRITRPARDG